MFLVFFLSLIKAVNYLLTEAAAVGAATGGANDMQVLSLKRRKHFSGVFSRVFYMCVCG